MRGHPERVDPVRAGRQLKAKGTAISRSGRLLSPLNLSDTGSGNHARPCVMVAPWIHECVEVISTPTRGGCSGDGLSHLCPFLGDWNDRRIRLPSTPFRPNVRATRALRHACGGCRVYHHRWCRRGLPRADDAQTSEKIAANQLPRSTPSVQFVVLRITSNSL